MKSISSESGRVMIMAKVADHPLTARLMHYVHIISIVLLGFTGFFIHYPFFNGAMATMRFIHFVAMYVLVFNLVARVYWSIFGAPRDIKEFFWSRENKGKFWAIIKYYLFLQKKHPKTGKYNPLQKIIYVFWGLLIMFQAYVGFALYWPDMSIFSPFVAMVGGLLYVRMIHFLVMWLFIVTAALHLYLVFAEDFVQVPYMFLGIKPKTSRN